MHMISKKDLSKAEMDTLTKSCSPYDSHNRQWRSANAWRGNCVCQGIGYILENEKSSRTRQQYCRSVSFAMKTGIPTNGSMVKNHISLKTEFGLCVTQRTSFQLWFLAWQVLPRRPFIILTGHLKKQESHSSSSSSSSSPSLHLQ